MTYRAQVGTVCDACTRSVPEDKLALDARGRKLCEECARRGGHAEIEQRAVSVLKSRRRARAFAITVAAIVFGTLLTRAILNGIESRQRDAAVRATHAEINARFDQFRAGQKRWRLDGALHDCDETAIDGGKGAAVEWIEIRALVGDPESWNLGSSDVMQLLDERSLNFETLDNQRRRLNDLESRGLLAVTIDAEREAPLGVTRLVWHGTVVLAKFPEGDPLCWAPMDAAGSASSTENDVRLGANKALETISRSIGLIQ